MKALKRIVVRGLALAACLIHYNIATPLLWAHGSSLALELIFAGWAMCLWVLLMAVHWEPKA